VASTAGLARRGARAEWKAVAGETAGWDLQEGFVAAMVEAVKADSEEAARETEQEAMVVAETEVAEVVVVDWVEVETAAGGVTAGSMVETRRRVQLD